MKYLSVLLLLVGMGQHPHIFIGGTRYESTCLPKMPPNPLIGECYHNDTGSYFYWTGAAWVHVEDDPLDVPAVQAAPKDCNWPKGLIVGGGDIVCDKKTGQLVSCMGEHIPQACYAAWFSEPLYTCSDKTRILEHDEQTPPKYWCRKVQP